jgi:hypothetical protein
MFLSALIAVDVIASALSMPYFYIAPGLHVR